MEDQIEALTIRARVAEGKNAEHEKKISQLEELHAYATKMLVQAMIQREEAYVEIELLKARHNQMISNFLAKLMVTEKQRDEAARNLEHELNLKQAKQQNK